MKVLTVQDVFTNAREYNVTLMGDDFIGYKFVGAGGEFWNSILNFMYVNGEDLDLVNSVWLNELNIGYVEYDNEVWSL